MHELRAVALGRFEDEVEMVHKQGEQVETDIVLIYPIRQPIDQPFAVIVIDEKPAPVETPVPDHPTGNMIDRPGILNSQQPCHAQTMPHHNPSVKYYFEG
jgi:hypothetical protein